MSTVRQQWEHLGLLVVHEHWHASNGDAGILGPLRMPTADPVYLYAALLDHYGQQGWELVSATTAAEAQRFFFKRRCA